MSVSKKLPMLGIKLKIENDIMQVLSYAISVAHVWIPRASVDILHIDRT